MLPDIQTLIFATFTRKKETKRMRKCLGVFMVSLLALGMSSCSEDFEVAAPYKDITVVYGMMNVGDTAQYIRIQKAFLDENKSALEMATVADSNFFRSIEVRMKEVKNGVANAGVVLPRVDMNLEGFPKPTGTFFNAPNWAYKYKGTLSPSSVYRLVITNLETGNVDSAETNVIDTTGGTTFNVQPLFSSAKWPLDFSANSTSVKMTQTVGMPSSAPAAYFEGYIKVNYVNEENGVQKDTFFIWSFAQGKPIDRGTGIMSADLTTTTNTFFSMVKAFIPPARDAQFRYLDSADMYIWAADKNYYNYAIANQITGGITADQVRPNYTTIRGKNVLGMFGSRARRIKYNVPITDATLDTLKKNVNLKPLGFVGRSDH